MKVNALTQERLQASHNVRIEGVWIDNVGGSPEIVVSLREVHGSRRWHWRIEAGELREQVDQEPDDEA